MLASFRYVLSHQIILINLAPSIKPENNGRKSATDCVAVQTN